jgi:hypothetical protein
MKNVRVHLEGLSPEVYARDLEALLRDLAPGKNGGVPAAWAW